LINDNAISEQVIRQMREKERTLLIRRDYSARDKAGLLAQCSLVVGMRLHSLIFAANRAVPMVGLVYDEKVRSCMKQLGIDRYALDLGAITAADLLKVMEEARVQHEAISKRLKAAHADLTLASEKSAVLTESLLNREKVERGPLSEAIQDLLKQTTLNLAAQVEDRERALKSLSLRVSEKEEMLGPLTAELENRQAAIARLSDEIAKQGETLKSQTAQLEETARQAHSLQSKLGIAEEQLAEKERAVSSLQAAVLEGEQEIASLDMQLAEKRRTIQRLSGELERITSSLGWRILSLYGPIKYRYLLPVYRLLKLMPPKKGPQPDSAVAPVGRVEASTPLLSGAEDRETSRSGTVVARHPYINYESNAYDVVCFPIIDWDFRFQRPQQLMSRFAVAGHRVFYIKPGFRASGEPYRLEEKAANIYEVSLRGPDRNLYRDHLDIESRDLLFASLDALRKELAIGAAAAVVQLPFWWPVAKKSREAFAWPIIYDCMDHHAGFSTNEHQMIEQEGELLRSAGLVVASSVFLEDEARRQNSNVLLIRNGCDFEHFAKTGPGRGERPVIGYYGAIADWFDSDLVAGLAEKRPDWDFILVGSTFTADTGRLSKLPNVRLTGEKPYGEVPGWLSSFDVAIIPFKRNPLTEATNPVKAYEMLAGGKPIVSVPLPEVALLAPLVRLASSVEGFEREIGAALLENVEGDPAIVERRRQFARANTWEDRFRLLAPSVRETFPKVSIVVVTYNNAHLNRLCLESIYGRTEWPNFEVIVVDNASSDETPEYLEQAEKTFPRLRVMLNKRNLGFAAANNQALKEAKGEYLVLLNNDTVVPRGWLSALIKHLNLDPQIGLIGPVTNEIGNEAKVSVGYERLEDMPSWAADFVRQNDGQTFPISVLAMFCIAMRREVFARIGALDESFQIGMFEDDDYTRRVREEGLKVVCARDSFVHHAGRASFKLLGDQQYREIFQKNRRIYEEKWGMWEPHLDEKDRERVAGLREHLNRIIAESGVDRGRIVIFLPSIGWDTPLVQRPHHLAAELARQGSLVFFDCAGSVIDHFADFAQIENNLWLYKGPKGVLDIIERPIVWTLPYNAHLVNRWASRVIVYDLIDDLSVFPYRQSMLRKNHQTMIEKADLVLYVARRLEGQIGGGRARALYVPNGVEYARFAAGSSLDELDLRFKKIVEEGRPVIGYYGAIASWLDAGLLSDVAEERKDWSFVLIGQKLPDAPLLLNLARKENVLILRAQPYETLPGYLSRFTAAMIPFKVNRITEATSPLKLFEYFAGGKPVISTPMPECEAFEEVLIARDAGEFSRALDKAKERSGDLSFQRRLQELGRQNSWEVRVGTVVRALEAEAAAQGMATGKAKAAVHASRPPSESQRERATVTRPRTPHPADEIARRFLGLRDSSNRCLFDALTEHFASISSDPDLPAHFEYAIRCNERGRQVADFFGERLDLSGKSYLEIGCAYGGGLVAMAERGAEVTGFESDGALLRLAAENLIDHGIDARLLSKDSTRASDLSEFRESFDIINCNRAINRVSDPQAFVENVADMLRDGGVACFEIPDGQHPGAFLEEANGAGKEMFERAGLVPAFVDEGPSLSEQAVLLVRKGRS
jgi:GT2 family glycosyltransferase/SAM-dependent methyltransferase